MLDVGCGTGRLAEWLAERWHARVFGVDPTAEMLEVARARGVRGVAFKLGRAERLPFKDGWFERATMVLVAHLVDRPAAFAEARRVLSEDGRLVIATFDPSHFPGYYLNDLFPSLLEVDLARFPSRETLERELLEAGFRAVRIEPFTRAARMSRETALARIRGRHISTFDLIGDEEYRAGLERAERELPEEIDYRFEMLILVAER